MAIKTERERVLYIPANKQTNKQSDKITSLVEVAKTVSCRQYLFSKYLRFLDFVHEIAIFINKFIRASFQFLNKHIENQMIKDSIQCYVTTATQYYTRGYTFHISQKYYSTVCSVNHGYLNIGVAD